MSQRASFGGDQTGFRSVAFGRKNSSRQFYNSLDRLDSFSERLEGVILHNKDYTEIIDQYGDGADTLIYMDPPYKRGTERYDWVDFDPGRFNNWCVKLGESEDIYSAQWMISSASVPLSIQCYPTVETDVIHQIGGDEQVTESSR
ncbi:DNA adenine methylase [Haloarcula sebkhae]|uniref:DNA adenine methylase n=2 Tax=Haloarcula sebkhae TaxID=932660 RepID=A0ACC6VR98_9EURY